MLVTRFGDTYSTAYVLPLPMVEDSIPRRRSPVVQRVANADGAFDFYGSGAWPIEPLLVRKRAIITAASWAAIDTALEALHTATIAKGEQRLWLELRDAQTKRWAWAKCRKLRTPDRVGQRLHCPVEMDFDLREGLWYAETASTHTQAGAATFVLTNNGDARVPVKVTVAANATATTAYAVILEGDDSKAIKHGWSFAGTLVQTKNLIVDAAAYLATNGGVNCFSSLTITDPAAFWFYLEPGVNNVTTTFTGGSPSAVFDWNDVYL